jgi:beta-glucosidase
MLLAGAAGATVLAATGTVTPQFAAGRGVTRRFPKDFRWGVATATHQIEGNDVNSDFWLLEVGRADTLQGALRRCMRKPPPLRGGHRAARRSGFNSYRFSLEWARIEPIRGQFSVAELDYYKRVVECCHRQRVDRAVTLMHATGPRCFAMTDGWLNRKRPPYLLVLIPRPPKPWPKI